MFKLSTRPIALSVATLVAAALLIPTETAFSQANPRKAPAADVQKSGTVLELQEGAPERYIVQRGDTLWSIANQFLKEPWRWPEFWRFNSDQINNPHVIYPGQVLVLDRLNRRVALDDRVKPRIRVEDGANAGIPMIPPNVIEPWLTRPLVIQPGGLDAAPQIVASEEGRYNLGPGGRAYVKGIPRDNQERAWTIYRQGRPLIDPETKEVLGIEAVYVGQARYVRAGDPSTITIASAQIEVTPGDRLLPAEKVRLVQYQPRSPERDVRARIISIYGGRGEQSSLGSQLDANRLDVADYDSRREAGPLQVVSINKGSRDGLDVGHVLALHRADLVKFDRSTGQHYMGRPRPADVQLPEERYGLVMVFRSFDRISYGLIMQATRTASPGDVALKP